MAVVYNVNHERLHLGIADPVMEIFKFAVAETEMRHEFVTSLFFSSFN
jgi:hypothetical protein